MQLTIGKKLGLGFGAVILLMILSAAMAYATLEGMDENIQRMVDEAVPIVRACDDLLISLNYASSSLRGYLLVERGSPRERELLNSFNQAWTNVNAAVTELTTRYEAQGATEEGKQFAAVRADLPPFETAQRTVQSAKESAGADMNAEADDLQQAIFTWERDSAPKAQAIRQAVAELRDAAVRRMNAERERVDNASQLVRWTLIGSTLLSTVLATILAVAISRRIAAAVQTLLARVQKVAAGELRGDAVQTRSNDELAELAQGINQMVASLREVLSQARVMTGEVAASSSEIATGAQQQLASLSETAASLNEITAASEEFKATMQEFADRARAVQDAADETAKRSLDGRQLTRDSAARIERVRANSLAAGESVLNLSEQMQRIGEITATVNEIAEQTKLLALNASIEAARAGEEGRGFAVVATQVRELANQSKEAVGRIESLIGDTQKSMQEVVTKIEEGGQLSDDSSEIVRRVAQAFEEIAQAVEQTREAMSQITTGAKQQEQGVGELVSSILQIDSASKESLTTAEQTQKSIVAIDARIRALNDAIAQFKV